MDKRLNTDSPELASLLVSVRRTFNPHQPISDPDSFFGREPQLGQSLSAIRTPGKNLLIYGSRGIGKTSLSNIVRKRAASDGYVVVFFQCSSLLNYKSVVRGLLSQLYHAKHRLIPGFVSRDEINKIALSVYLEGDSSPNRVIQILRETGGRALLVIDEFDQLARKQRANISHLIKAASDLGGDSVKIVVVGVGETTDDLLSNHPSIERNVAQIGLEPMASTEISEMLQVGAEEIGVGFEPDVLSNIVMCSQGFPYVARLLAQHSMIQAVSQGQSLVASIDFQVGLKSSIEDIDRSMRRAYSSATYSPRPSRFAEILYFAALAVRDEFGFFSIQSVVDASARRSGSAFKYGSLHNYLNKLSEKSRAEVLTRHETRRSHFRFSNPLMRQFAIMRWLAAL